MVGRISKIVLVLTMGLYMGLVALNNALDRQSNLLFVQHVLSMDTVFPDTPLRARAITSPVLQDLFFSSIVAWELLSGLLCVVGAVLLIRNLRADATRLQRAKELAEFGLVTGLLLWLVAFLTVGGEWFLMWQSHQWNGQNAAGRMFVVTGLLLVYLKQPDTELRTRSVEAKP